MPTREEIIAELERRRAARATAGPSSHTPVDPTAPPEPNQDALRALRTGWMMDAQESAFNNFWEAAARLKDLERRTPDHPMLPELRERLLRDLPTAGSPVSPDQATALLRERARTGQPNVPIGTPAQIREALARGAKVIDPSGRTADRVLGAVGSGVTSAIEYPLKLIPALLRPIDAPVPAAAKALIEGKPVGTAITAGMDPLGRFTPEGAETGSWTNPRPSYQDAIDAAFKRWGKDEKVGVVGMSSDPARVGQPVTERTLGGVSRGPLAAAGVAADILGSPSTYLGAAGASGKGVTVAGKTVIPDSAVTTVARAPGSIIEKATEAIATKMALNPKVSLQAAHRVGRAGEILGNIGPAQTLTGVPKLIGAWAPFGGPRTLGDLAGSAFDRFHLVKKIRDPQAQAKSLEFAQLRESSTQADTANLTARAEKILGPLSKEDRQLIRDMVESPSSFDWNVPKREPLNFPGRAITPRPPTAVGPASPPPPGRPKEIPVQGTHTTSGPNTMFGEGASPTAVPGTPDAMRYGAHPSVGQVPVVTEEQRELVARLENLLRDARTQLEGRGLIPEGGRPNYFPRERTRESLIQWEGEGARLESLGRGVDPRKDFRAGFQKARTEANTINGIIDRVNAQLTKEAAAKGQTPRLIEHVEDSTGAINRFWRELPEPLRRKLTAEPERMLDDPLAALQRYLARVSKSVNDYDVLQAVRQGKTGALPRPFAYEANNGRVFERWDTPAETSSFQRPVAGGPGVMVDRTPAHPNAPKLGEGDMGRRREAMTAPPRRPVAGELPGEVPPGGAEAFRGKSPLDEGVKHGFREIPGYVYPTNPAWRKAFPNVAVPKDHAAWIDAMGKPYWATEDGAAFFERMIIQPAHRLMLPWKVAATSGAGPRFALRNYMGQQGVNYQAYGVNAFAPRIQKESHILGLPDEVFSKYPKLGERVITDATGRQWKASELRAAAQQSGLWRTMPEAETWTNLGQPFELPSASSSMISGWESSKAKLSAALSKVERGAKKATDVIGPVNPISRNFIPTRGVAAGPGGMRLGWHPMAEYGERQGRMAALILELDQGKGLWEAAQSAGVTHVNYQTFSPTFEKYATLAWPFAKFTAGMTPNQIRWSLEHPGRTMTMEHVMRGGEAMVPEDVRKRYESEPKSQLIKEAGGRLVGYPWVGVLQEPEVGRAKGEGRLPYVAFPPTTDVFLNKLGAVTRIAGARSSPSQIGKEVMEGAFPVFKAPFEWATGRNVYTGEPVETLKSAPAPRAVQAFYAASPKLAASIFKAAPVVNDQTGQSFLAVPQSVALIWRYFPNVSAFDLVAGVMGVKRPYDNQTAMALRLLGVTQIMHDPQIPATQAAFEEKKIQEKNKQVLDSWLPPPTK